MTGISRRDFTRIAGATGLGTLAGSVWSPFVAAQGAAKVVIVGGGAGGATAAHYIKKDAPELDVTLIEANPIYSSSFFSNLYIGGFRTLESLNHTYGGLSRLGIKVVHDTATDVDTAKKTVKTKGGRSYKYDRLILSPGIDVKYDSVPGYSREVSRTMPHAYTTSAEGKRLLKRQLQGMRDGGTVVMVTPNNPFRCPPGPYERACMIAHFIKTKKPKSKLVISESVRRPATRNRTTRNTYIEAARSTESMNRLLAVAGHRHRPIRGRRAGRTAAGAGRPAPHGPGCGRAAAACTRRSRWPGRRPPPLPSSTRRPPGRSRSVPARE